MTFSTGRLVLSFVAFSTAAGGFIFDWNHTHVFNERWPPHAKFHNGQTMSTGLLLGLSGLYYLFRTCSSPAMQADSLRTATWLLSLNWIAQLSAALYPGALPVDPEFGGGFPQAYICAFLFFFIALGFRLEVRRLRHDDKRD